MRVPVEWLKELVNFPFGIDELCHRLTMIGLEVEGSEEMRGDTVLEVNVTPNRPDCLSILGIAREVAALMNGSVQLPDYVIEGDGGASPVDVEILDEDLCHRYAGRALEEVRIGDSPEWMKMRLEKCRMRPINNVVDITNYVLLEMGHPLHAFDMDELRGGRIRVAKAGAGSKIATLDGTERSLPEDALLIWDAERPVAVAGVMGGAETEVKAETKNVFLESAYFFPSSVRRTSRALGLKTESSYRFERGTDIELLEKALDRAAFLMARLTGGRVSRKVDAYPKPFQPSSIEVRYGRVRKILGIAIPIKEMIDIVKRLGIAVAEGPSSFTATPPPYRTDLQREIDVIEEIARFYGYERIPVTVPKTGIPQEAKGRRYEHISAIRESFTGAGFTEVINYSFMNHQMLDMLNLDEDDARRRTLPLRNPINIEEGHLRTSLIPSLIQNLVYNVSMGNRDVRLYELSRVFFDKGETLPEEMHHLGAISFREKSPSLWKEETPSFYMVKGVVESLADLLRMHDCRFRPSCEPFLHPGKSCDILASDRKVGFFGVLHPTLVEKLSVKISRHEIIVLEIDVDALFPSISEKVSYTPFPKYPHVDRDVALIVDESLPASALEELIRAYPTDLMEEISLFDFYKGKNIPDGKKSLAFSIRYRAKDRTLTDSEIEELHSRLVTYITENTGGIVRGA
ncbi:MAG TPA: phenylalanine--tRNA ligase subunit beta [Thermodesulfovibrionales bacterium]|nr:phenylalanine--tRNA ligase subunit beta [Thermodesulfovibrionales bacterium]